ncbi:hypothetical protein GOP47_0028944 [Adiantum capillus-veneris]|nr:hypothetical protein GOP47_0028944 [Adiantum capillus-veneris]
MAEIGYPPQFDSKEETREIDVEWNGELLKNPTRSFSSPSGAGELSVLAAGEVIEVADHSLKGAGELSIPKGGIHSPHEAEQQIPSEPTGDHTLHQVLPLHEPIVNSSKCPRLALLVFSIVALNVGVFFVTMYINNCPNTTKSCLLSFLHRLSFQPLSENALLGPSSQTLERLGALNAVKVQHAHQGWRVMTCIWLHAGVVHVIVNMLSLLFVGVRLEQEFGPVKIGIIYLLSGFGGSLLSVLFLQSISVGASGALFGLVGAMLAELLANWTIYVNKCAVTSVLVLVVTANLAMGILPFVDNFAHIGGLIVGFLSGLVLLLKPQYGFVKPFKSAQDSSIQSSAKAKYNAYQYSLWVTALILLVIGVTSVAILVFRGADGNKKCKWCHYLSCVPTSKWKCHSSAVCDELQVGNMWQIICTSKNESTLAPLNQTQDVLQQLCTQLCS